MLQTLLKLGQQSSQNQNRGMWDDLLKFPAVEAATKKGDPITNYCLPVQFDLDAGTVSVGDLREYHEDSPREWFNLAIGGGNNPSVYVCVDGRKNLGQFTKTFFGKSAAASKGELLGELAKARQPDDSPLAEALRRILPLRAAFEALAADEKGEISLRKLSSGCALRATDRAVLVYATVKCTELGWPEFRPFVRVHDGEMDAVPGYAEFITARFPMTRPSVPDNLKLCYATGKPYEDVDAPNLPRNGDSLNRMFVKTTVHYAPTFNDDDFALNYQISGANQLFLERGSKMILARYTTTIAGVKHCLIPKLLSTDSASIESRLPQLKQKADLLFQSRKMTAFTSELEEDVDLYWISFLGFESDGNSLKAVNVIDDVSQTYFSQLILAFRRLNNDWQKTPDIPWERVMNNQDFNLNTVYHLIPLRWDSKKRTLKDKRNAALLLFKQILERRPVSRRRLFEHFRELILCHRYRRYPAYGNVYDNNQNDTLSAAQAFDYAARNAVYQYLAFFRILTQFQLLSSMNDNQETSLSATQEPTYELSDTQQKEEDFFLRMEYQAPQKAMFYLGRALAKVARVQAEKGYKSKPIMEKLNYSGMDVKAIIRLSEDLMDKVRQFQLSKEPKKSPEKALRHFTAHFKYNGWNMPPEEALFFILSGYSYTTK